MYQVLSPFRLYTYSNANSHNSVDVAHGYGIYKALDLVQEHTYHVLISCIQKAHLAAAGRAVQLPDYHSEV